MSETKASMVRRAITRADEDEVRRRVATIESRRLPVDVLESGRFVIDGWQGIDPPSAAHRTLATVGIFPGASGWEIETRRALPEPWAWRPYEMGSEFLARRNSFSDVVAVAKPNGAEVWKSEEDTGETTKIPAASLAEARERAEDECWSRGLFGVVEDAPPAKPVAAPPVDMAQAIRDALLASLADGNRASMPALLSDAVTATGDESLTSADVLAGLGAIGAVTACSAWRLSDGPPPGWEWATDGRYWLRPIGSTDTRDSIALVGRDCSWKLRAGDTANAVSFASSIGVAQAAALLACRRAGLFAPPVTAEPTDTHRDPAHEATVADLEAQIAGLVARLATVTSNEATVAALRAEIVALTRREFAAREGARGLGVQCRAAEDARDMYWRRAEAAEGKLAPTEKILARVTGERDEARLNVVDARAHCAKWRHRAERAEAMVAAMRALLDAPGKATP